MAQERDGKATFDYFMDQVDNLHSDQHFRAILRELDEGRKDTLSLLVSDPAAYLRHRGLRSRRTFGFP